MTISLKKVRDLYPNGKVVNVEEYYHPLLKWSSILPNGTDVRDSDLYYAVGVEGVIKMCITAGAERIQFKISDSVGGGKREYCFPDYKVRELIEL
jgi:hypothetical protein